LAAAVVERVAELGDTIRGIDVDEDQSGFGGGKLGQHPFAVIRRPDADAVAGFKPEREQPGSNLVDDLPQLAVTETDLLMTDHQRRTRCPRGASFVEKLSDGLADQRPIAGAVHIAEPESGRPCHGRSSRYFEPHYSAQ